MGLPFNRGGQSPAVRTVVETPLSASEILDRQATCTFCDWNIRNKCQHPRQGCAPCKQGVGLLKAVERRSFNCPESGF